MTVDHVTESLATLPSQFQDKTGWTAAVTALVTPIQALEDVLQDVLLQRILDNAIGAQLDDIGRLVGQARLTTDDDQQRRYVRARIAANRSGGTGENVLTISVLVVDDVAAHHVIENLGGAALFLRLEDVAVSNDVATILIGFLRTSVLAGVKIVLISSAAVPDETLAAADPLTVQFRHHDNLLGSWRVSAGALDGSENGASDISAFPASGTLDVLSWSAGIGNGCRLSYTSKGTYVVHGITHGCFLGGVFLSGAWPTEEFAYIALASDNHTGLAIDTALNGVHVLGTTVLTCVANHAGFPEPAGSLTLSAGTTTEETVTYAGYTGNGVFAISALTFDQPNGAAVVLATGGGSTSLYNEAFANAGGQLAAARE